jgi:hypothetical protein
MKMKTTVAALTVIVVLGSVYAGLSGANADGQSASDPIVGLWSSETLFKGSLWVGYMPDGQVAYILDPSKPPGTLGSLAAVNATYVSTGKWTRKGSVYTVMMFRNGTGVGLKSYKVTGEQLVECGQDGTPKSGGEQWSRQRPADTKTLDFISAYIKTREKLPKEKQ